MQFPHTAATNHFFSYEPTATQFEALQEAYRNSEKHPWPSSIIENSDPERQLTPFRLLPGHQRGHQCTAEPFDPWRIFWERKIESSDKRNKERLDFDDAVSRCKSRVWSTTESTRKKLMAYENLHPMQLLCPPENEALCSARLSIWCENHTTTLQIPVYPECRFGFLVHLEPALRSERVGVGTPHVTVPVKRVRNAITTVGGHVHVVSQR